MGWQRALRDLGGDLPLDEYYQYIGKSAESNALLLTKKMNKGCPDLLLKIKNEYYLESCRAGLPPIDATVNFLKTLANRGIKIGVCSAAIKEEILIHLHHLGIEDHVDIVLSGHGDLGEYFDPEGVNKPKPYIYLHAMKQLGVTASDCIVIEDSTSGIQAGNAAGCFTIAVPNAFTVRQDLSEAHLRLESFKEMNIDYFLKLITSRQ